MYVVYQLAVPTYISLYGIHPQLSITCGCHSMELLDKKSMSLLFPVVTNDWCIMII